MSGLSLSAVGGWILAGLLATGCSRGVPLEDALAQLKANPGDVETAARIAMAGRPVVAGLIRLLEEAQGEAGRPLRRVVSATLFVMGDVVAAPAVEYLDQGKDRSVKTRLLKLISAGRWKAGVRKLVQRIGDPDLGGEIYETLAHVLAGEEIPPNPAAKQGNEREMALLQWNQWLQRNLMRYVPLDLVQSNVADLPVDKVQALISAEASGPRWE